MALEVVKEEKTLVLVLSRVRPVFDEKGMDTGASFQSVEHVYDRKITLSDGSVLTDQVSEETPLDKVDDSVAADMVKAIQSVADKTGAAVSVKATAVAEEVGLAEPIKKLP